MSVKVYPNTVQEHKPSELLIRLEERSWQTPDFDQLRLRKHIVLFVYDNMMKGGNDHEYLTGAKFLGRSQTVSSEYTMKSAVDCPIVFPEKVMVHACIRGEAFLVGPQHILAIDKFQRNNHYMTRRLTRVLLPEQKDAPGMSKTQNNNYLTSKWSWAFIYEGNKTHFSQGKGLTSRSTRQERTENTSTFEQRPYYKWDVWEADWPFESGFRAAGIWDHWDG